MQMPLLLFRLTLSIAMAATPALAIGQGMVPAATPNADRLAVQMRRLAERPDDLDALIEAGELSVRLGDPAAALGFFGRAEQVAPGNARILAGRGAALVALERPGEALRFFYAAERAGLKPYAMAADRGLAYDLLGYPDHAQRQYRIALDRDDDDAEVKRRLALSLGISGKLDEATRVLDPLLRRNDRAAWRVRAFTLAMNGDVPQAERIAAGLLPGFGPSLLPFFQRLGTLGPSDRAFAAHFGQLRPTAARLADARLAPGIQPIPGSGEVALAAADIDARRLRRTASGRTAPATPEVATQPRVSEALSRAAPSTHESLLGRLRRDRAEQGGPDPTQERGAVDAQPATRPASPVRRAALPAARSGRFAPPPPPTAMAAPLTVARPAEPVAPAGGQTMPAAAPAPAPTPAPPASVASPPADVPAAAQSSVADHEANLRALGDIVRRLTETAEATNVQPAPAATEAPVAAPRMAAPVARGPAPQPQAAAKVTPAKAPPAKPRAPAEPARHWVQVAGGANRADLPVAWERLRKQAPDAFRGKQGWTTPLRATNRLLAGPFKTANEAQSFVNQLGKQGISAFAWQSEAGQKVERLKAE